MGENASTRRKRLNRQKGECTWCGGPVPKGCRTWCGNKCVQEFRRTNDWGVIRWLVFERDAGICLLCGCDTLKIQNLMCATCHEVRYYLLEFYTSIGFDSDRFKDQWQADHIVPRVRGGGDDLSNLRTLCTPCHKVETKRLAGERAAERRDAKRTLLKDSRDLDGKLTGRAVLLME